MYITNEDNEILIHFLNSKPSTDRQTDRQTIFKSKTTLVLDADSDSQQASIGKTNYVGSAVFFLLVVYTHWKNKRQE